MENRLNVETIKVKLDTFDYKYKDKEGELIVYLPILCYIKVKYTGDNVKFTSRTFLGFNFLSLEFNFLFYSLVFYFTSYFYWTTLNKGIFVLFGIFILYFIICIIKVESLKIIMHNWIDQG